MSFYRRTTSLSRIRANLWESVADTYFLNATLTNSFSPSTLTTLQ